MLEMKRPEINCVEIDVMTTKDNHVVLFHDHTLKRFDGTNRRIKDMTLAEVRQVDNGSYINKSFEDERIPTLDEVLSVAKGSIQLNIELKGRVAVKVHSGEKGNQNYLKPEFLKPIIECTSHPLSCNFLVTG